MDILIIGYGSAGHRWEKFLLDRGVHISTYDTDPFACASYRSLPELHDYDLVVVATPPDHHLQYIDFALESGTPVLCEKPLCGIGQLDEAVRLFDDPNADKVVVAYNYIWNPQVWALKQSGLPILDCVSISRRKQPAWGFEVDNLSHTMSILAYIDPTIKIIDANTYIGDHSWRSSFWAAGKVKASATDLVFTGENNLTYINERVAGIQGRRNATDSGNYYDTTKSVEAMFEGIWQDTLNMLDGVEAVSNFGFALLVQDRLEQLVRKINGT